MYLAYCDFMVGAGPHLAACGPVTLPEDDTASLAPPISPQDIDKWKTGAINDKYDLLLIRAGQIVDAFSFGCHVDLTATTTNGLDLPVPSVWIPLAAPPVLNSGTKIDWTTYLASPSDLAQMNPPLAKSSVILSGLIYDTALYPTSNLQTDVVAGNGLALCSRMFDYQTLLSWDGAYVNKSSILWERFVFHPKSGIVWGLLASTGNQLCS
jgi:hypothetical protein